MDTQPRKIAVKLHNAANYVKRNTKIIFIGLIVLGVLVAYVHQVQTTNDLKKQNQQLSNPQVGSTNQATLLRDDVAKLVQLPDNEIPTIATVSDVAKLQNQTFFANAKDGDKVLIFNMAKEAILYRPSSNKIIEIAPLSSGSSSTTSNTNN
jgi:4-hydroxy-3-methylbut-2-enyl diphosphate reductase IspH